MTEEELKEIEARANAANYGPWEFVPNVGGIAFAAGGERWWVFVDAEQKCIGDDEPHPDMHFIAHARTDIPKLIARIRELEKVADRIYEYSEEDLEDIKIDKRPPKTRNPGPGVKR